MVTLNFSPFPVLETERLILRRPVFTDRQMLFEMRSNPETMQYIPRPLAKSLEDVDALLNIINGFTDKNEKINWAITEKGNDTMLGMIGYPNFRPDDYRAEVGYIQHHNYRGKGYVREALGAVLDYGFQTLKLHSIEAIIRPENEGSRKLVQHFGFVREAYFKDYVFHNGQFWDEEVYSLIAPGK